MSTDHVSVAVHDLGGDGPPLLFSHATGFHGYCYLPIADRLSDRFHGWAFDHRGHGSTPRSGNGTVDWQAYGDDAEAVARHLAPDGGLIGFGHSMGGVSLLMVADRSPGLFDMVIVFEPIVIPHAIDVELSVPLAEAARRRRASFESFDAAIRNYGSKPPMDAFDGDVLRLYVGHGFGAAPEGIRLKCDPAHEAATFATGHLHDTYDRLPEISVPVVVVYGDDADGAALFAPSVAERLPDAVLVRADGTSHFAPFTDPALVANLIARLVDERDGRSLGCPAD